MGKFKSGLFGVLIMLTSGTWQSDPATALARLATSERPVAFAPFKPQTANPKITGPESQKPLAAEVIWPPIDQALDFRGGYKRRMSAVRGISRPTASTPGQLSDADCAAAGAFILAGARARDRGVSAQSFMSRLRTDLLKLGAEPPDKRWFLHTEREANLLHSAARDIFAKPSAPATHYRDFVAQCETGRISSVTGWRY